MRKFIILLSLLKLSPLISPHFQNCLSERITNLGIGTVVMKLSLERYHEFHQKMIKEIEIEIEETAEYTGINCLSPKLLRALKLVPRHLFVMPGDEANAYANAALPISEGQTISQPFMVAIMTELLDIQSSDKVLEIGTGSGYQSAILSQLAEVVYTVEVISSLAESAKIKFNQFGYRNIHAIKRDGNRGWKEHAPYNKIIVTAATKIIPTRLLEQLNNNGIMVLPLGQPNGNQFLTIVHKNEIGEVTQRILMPVKFVPII